MSAPCPRCGRTDYELLLTKSGNQIYVHPLRSDGRIAVSSVCFSAEALAESLLLLRRRAAMALHLEHQQTLGLRAQPPLTPFRGVKLN